MNRRFDLPWVRDDFGRQMEPPGVHIVPVSHKEFRVRRHFGGGGFSVIAASHIAVVRYGRLPLRKVAGGWRRYLPLKTIGRSKYDR